MDYNRLFENGSLAFVREFVGKIVYDGLGVKGRDDWAEPVIVLVSTLIIIFFLYKLMWLVLRAMIFVIKFVKQFYLW